MESIWLGEDRVTYEREGGLDYKFYPSGSSDDPLDQRWTLVIRGQPTYKDVPLERIVGAVSALLYPAPDYEVLDSASIDFAEEQPFPVPPAKEQRGILTPLREQLRRADKIIAALAQAKPKPFERCEECPYGTLCTSLEVCHGPLPELAKDRYKILREALVRDPAAVKAVVDEQERADHYRRLLDEGWSDYEARAIAYEEQPMKDEHAEAVQALREADDHLDDLLASVEAAKGAIGRGGGGREVAVAKTKLQEVGYWLKEARRLVGDEG